MVLRNSTGRRQTFFLNILYFCLLRRSYNFISCSNEVKFEIDTVNTTPTITLAVVRFLTLSTRAKLLLHYNNRKLWIILANVKAAASVKAS